jgi:hypothetical protein
MEDQVDWMDGKDIIAAFAALKNNAERTVMVEQLATQMGRLQAHVKEQESLRKPDRAQQAVVSAIVEKKKKKVEERNALTAKLAQVQDDESEYVGVLTRLGTLSAELKALESEERSALERGDVISSSLRERLDAATVASSEMSSKVEHLENELRAVNDRLQQTAARELDVLVAMAQKEEAHAVQASTMTDLRARVAELEGAKMADEQAKRRSVAAVAEAERALVGPTYLDAAKPKVFALSSNPNETGFVRITVMLPTTPAAGVEASSLPILKLAEVVQLLKGMAETWKSDVVRSVVLLMNALNQGRVTRQLFELAWSTLSADICRNFGVMLLEKDWELILRAWENQIPAMTRDSLSTLLFSGSEPFESFLVRHQSLLTLLEDLGVVKAIEIVEHLVYKALPASYVLKNQKRVETLRSPDITSLRRLLDEVGGLKKNRQAMPEQYEEVVAAMPAAVAQQVKGKQTGRTTAAATPIDGQDPMRPNLASLTCKGCGDSGHIRAYCPKESVESRRQIHAKFMASRKKKEPKPAPAGTVSLPAVEKNVVGEAVVMIAQAPEFSVLGDMFLPDGRLVRRNVVLGLDTWCKEFSLISADMLPSELPRTPCRVLLTGIGSQSVSEAVRIMVKNAGGKASFVETFLVVEGMPAQMLLSLKRMDDLGWSYSDNCIMLAGEKWARITASAGMGWTAMPSKAEMAGRQPDYKEPMSLSHVAGSGLMRHLEPLPATLPNAVELNLGPRVGNVLEPHTADGTASSGFGHHEWPPSKLAAPEEAILHRELELMANDCPVLCSDVERARYRDLLQRHEMVFRMELKGKPQSSQEVDFGIPAGTFVPSQPMRVVKNPEVRDRAQARVDQFLENGIVAKGRVQVMSNLVIIDEHKVDEQGKPFLKTRITINMSTVNGYMPDGVNNIRPPHEAFYKASGAVCFGGSDESDAFFQLQLSEASKQFAGFWGPNGEPYHFNRMPPGAKIAPEALHKVKMDQYSSLPVDNFAWIFDDALMWTRATADDPRGVEAMFQLLESFLAICEKAGTILKPSKTRFFQFERKHQGFVYSKDGLRRDEAAVAPVLLIPPATSVSEVRSFLGVMEPYIAGTPVLRLLLTALHFATKKNAWDDAETPRRVAEAMKLAQEALAVETLRHFPDFSRRMVWRVDAGDLGMSAVVGQRVLVNGHKEFKPVWFWSRPLQGMEPLYWATEREVVAWSWALVDKGRSFSQYSRNVIISDAKSVENFRKVADTTTNRVIAHSLLELQQLNLRVRCVPRAELSDVDGFPRLLYKAPQATGLVSSARFLSEDLAVAITGSAGIEQVLWDSKWDELIGTVMVGALAPGLPIDLVLEQLYDPDCDFVRAALRGDFREKTGRAFATKFDQLPEAAQKAITAYRGQDPDFKRFRLVDNVLLYTEPPAHVMVPYIPLCLRERVVRAFHNSALGSHRGRDATLIKLKQRVFWFGMSKQSKAYIKRCLPCLETKSGQLEYGGLSALQVSEIGDVIAYDLIGPLKQTAAGYVFVGLATELVTGYVMMVPLKSKAGIGSARFLLERVVFFFGQFKELQVDGAPDLCKGIVKALMDLLEIKLRQTPAFSPMVNGGTERRNGTAGVLLRILVNEAGDDWDQQLPYVEYGMNNAMSHRGGATPMVLVTGRDPITPFDRLLGRRSPVESLGQFQERVEKMRSFMALSTAMSKKEMMDAYNSDRPDISLKEGDSVMVYWPPAHKLLRKWHGPYVLEKPLSDSKRVWTVHHPAYPLDRFTVHVNRLRLVELGQEEVFVDKDYEAWTRSAMADAVSEAEVSAVLPEEEVRRDLADPELDYEIEAIIDHRDVPVKNRVGKSTGLSAREYLVKFVGYPPSANLWLLDDDLANASTLVASYEESLLVLQKAKLASRRKGLPGGK